MAGPVSHLVWKQGHNAQSRVQWPFAEDENA